MKKRNQCANYKKEKMRFKAGGYKLIMWYWLFRHLLGNKGKKQHGVLIAQAFSPPINGQGISSPPAPESHQHLLGFPPGLVTPPGARLRAGVEHHAC